MCYNTVAKILNRSPVWIFNILLSFLVGVDPRGVEMHFSRLTNVILNGVCLPLGFQTHVSMCQCAIKWPTHRHQWLSVEDTYWRSRVRGESWWLVRRSSLTPLKFFWEDRWERIRQCLKEVEERVIDKKGSITCPLWHRHSHTHTADMQGRLRFRNYSLYSRQFFYFTSLSAWNKLLSEQCDPN